LTLHKNLPKKTVYDAGISAAPQANTRAAKIHLLNVNTMRIPVGAGPADAIVGPSIVTRSPSF
jgi:hypothetical protein